MGGTARVVSPSAVWAVLQAAGAVGPDSGQGDSESDITDIKLVTTQGTLLNDSDMCAE